MFLLYRNKGERWYGREPIQPYLRETWQFQFFLEGESDLILREEGTTRTERLIAPVVVVTGPQCNHGWGGRPTDHCLNLIFHFDEIDYAVRTIVGNAGYRKLRFRSSEIPFLQALYDRCAEARKAIGTTPLEVQRRAGFLEPLIYRVVASELALFFLRHLPKSEMGTPANYGETKVNEAMAWYEANLQLSPNIADVARAIHLSPTHLRRLFHKIRGVSPQSAFTHVQFERAKWLMRDPEMTLEQIGESAGFGSGSAFSRAFKAQFDTSPRDYREQMRNRRGKAPAGG